MPRWANPKPQSGQIPTKWAHAHMPGGQMPKEYNPNPNPDYVRLKFFHGSLLFVGTR